MNNKKKKLEDNRGSVLILTVIITSVLFGIGISIASILEKEFKKQIDEDRSIIALNLANTAFECTLYNDFRRRSFEPADSPRFDCGNVYQVREKGIDGWKEAYVPESTELGGVSGTGKFEFVVIQLNREQIEHFGDGLGGIDEDISPDADSDAASVIGTPPCAEVIVEKRCLLGVEDDDSDKCKNDLIENSVEVKGYFSCTEDGGESELVRRFKVYY